MDLVIGLAGFALSKLRSFYLASDVVVNVGALVGFLVVAIGAERLARYDTSRYFGRGARTDALYTVFYLGGFYAILFGGPIGWVFKRLLMGFLPFLELNLLARLPVAIRAVVALAVLDVARYWLHRWTHSSRVLWAFHQIHHSQEALAPLTNFRFHFIDYALHGLTIIVVYVLLGPPPEMWLLVGLVFTWINLLAHSGYRWSFGPLELIFVSPRYHALHHSIEPEHANHNFGMTFSLWDHLFGTAARATRPPRAFGIPEPKLPESFFSQFAAPFLRLGHGHRVRRAGA